ncbi:MAG: phosphoribosylamine--glycine ligase [Syntrophobacterales bacterium]|nr:MAG: phosphoribosylamine--glycine ligase [Syntrophobacterales bacterium]
MKVMIVGSGGREHSLVWKIGQSPRVSKLFCAPGNAGIAQMAECIDIPVTDLEALAAFADKSGVDLTVVGPEVPLTMGVVDFFEERGLRIFGPHKDAAEIEGSKVFCKELMSKYGIPTAQFQAFKERNEAAEYVEHIGAPVVVKADGLAAGKGVIPSMTKEDALEALNKIMVERAFGDAGKRVVIEEFLIGEEASFIVLTDGETVVPFASSQDHKPIYDGDRGPNTGGMGAYSPAPVVTEEVHKKIMDEIMIPITKGMASEGRPYRGVLYGGLMIKDGQVKVLEFNARFGDPENQPIMMRMRGDIIPLLEACIDGNLQKGSIDWDPRWAVCVVMASKGYPGSYEKNKVIQGLDRVMKREDVFVFHAGTARAGEDIVTNGGRVIGVTALGEDARRAIDLAYSAARKIKWDGVYFRSDIGKRALDRPR